MQAGLQSGGALLLLLQVEPRGTERFWSGGVVGVWVSFPVDSSPVRRILSLPSAGQAIPLGPAPIRTEIASDALGEDEGRMPAEETSPRNLRTMLALRPAVLSSVCFTIGATPFSPPSPLRCGPLASGRNLHVTVMTLGSSAWQESEGKQSFFALDQTA